MAYNNGKISAPVSIHDIQQCCWVRLQRTVSGQTQTKYSGDDGVLCGAKVGDIIPATDGNGSWTVTARGKINKWARYKPERADGPRLLYYDAGQRSRKGNNFGLDIPYCHYDPQRIWYNYVMNGMVADILLGDFEPWEYLQPRGDMTGVSGGVKEFYRLSDWVRILTDTTDPFYNTVYAKGYNHNARIPFFSWMDMAGVTVRQDGVYEINKQVSNTLTILFQNSIGDDLHLQDFITLGTDSRGRAWRPVLQVFADAREYDDTTGQYEDWDMRDFADMEACGDAITADEGNTIWSVSLDLSSFQSSAVTLFHLCVGVGYVNSDFSSWGDDPTKSLFLIPFKQGETPFHYKFAVVSYQARKLEITALSFYADGIVRWVDAGGTAPYFTIHSLATGYVRLTMTISKLPSQKVDFIGENGTPDSGYAPLKIQARETVTGISGETIKYPNPTDSNWQNASHTHIAEGQTSETQTIYATMYLGNIPVGGYSQCHMYAYTGASDQQGNPQWDNIGYFSVQKIQYTN